MLARAWFALTETWHNRTQLRHYMTDPGLRMQRVITLAPHTLLAHHVRGLILDFDGVLASHAESVPREEVERWLRFFAQQYAPHKIYILSNKPTRGRLDYFKKNFPNIIFVIPTRKKPYPDGLLQIIEMSKLDPHNLLLVDDRLMTGILAAVLTGVQATWITHPYRRVWRRPLRETFFFLMRRFERSFIRLIT
jgi:predicted HAD superfamily phosphohydrolase YqeG